jgi:hypothetical protein
MFMTRERVFIQSNILGETVYIVVGLMISIGGGALSILSALMRIVQNVERFLEYHLVQAVHNVYGPPSSHAAARVPALIHTGRPLRHTQGGWTTSERLSSELHICTS